MDDLFTLRDIIIMAVLGALIILLTGAILGVSYMYHIIKNDHIPKGLKDVVVYKKKNSKPREVKKRAESKPVDIMEEL